MRGVWLQDPANGQVDHERLGGLALELPSGAGSAA